MRLFGAMLLGVVLSGVVLMSGSAHAAGPVRSVVEAGPAQITVLSEGAGPLVVMLPSRGRDSEDYGEVAAAIAGEGFRVLRPQPRGMLGSTGLMARITLHDLAADVAAVIRAENDGQAVIVGHAYGNWIARMTAVDSPSLVRGVVLAASAAKSYPAELSVAVTRSADMSLPEAERRQALQNTFFAPGHDPAPWLTGWHEKASRSQREAADRTSQAAWWSGGSVPLLDLQAGNDPFRPAATRGDLRTEFGDRVSVAVIPNTSHALLPEAPDAVAAGIVGWMRALPAR
jgi:pimeloyl-ACP methyl ester carboxylesterase